VLEQDINHSARVAHVIVGVEPALLEQGVFAHQVLNGVLEGLDDALQVLAPGWLLDVEDDFVLDSKFPGDRQGVF
jgi:hypothetical protein